MSKHPNEIADLVERARYVAAIESEDELGSDWTPAVLEACAAEIEKLRQEHALRPSAEAQWRAQPGPWAHLTKEQTDTLIADAIAADRMQRRKPAAASDKTRDAIVDDLLWEFVAVDGKSPRDIITDIIGRLSAYGMSNANIADALVGMDVVDTEEGGDGTS